MFTSDEKFKLCSKCKKYKCVKTEYNKDKSKAGGIYSACQDCTRAANRAIRKKWSPEQKIEKIAKQKQWRVNNPEKAKKAIRNATLKKKYGIDIEDYEKMIINQNNKCANLGCLRDRAHLNNSERFFHVDHDHITGKVRGLLCQPCNTSLGLLEESMDRIMGLVNYLETYQ